MLTSYKVIVIFFLKNFFVVLFIDKGESGVDDPGLMHALGTNNIFCKNLRSWFQAKNLN